MFLNHLFIYFFVLIIFVGKIYPLHRIIRRESGGGSCSSICGIAEEMKRPDDKKVRPEMTSQNETPTRFCKSEISKWPFVKCFISNISSESSLKITFSITIIILKRRIPMQISITFS